MPSIRILICLVILLRGGGICLAVGDQRVDFDRQIQPLLSAKCGRCHSDKIRKADLDLLTISGLLKGGEGGPVLVPGNPDKSSLFERVRKGEMPPGGKDQLSNDEQALLRRWISEGAKLSTTAPEAALTQHDVIPILLRHCAPCHGRHKQEAGLDLRTPLAMLKGGKSGPAVLPGKPNDSLVIQHIASGKMPPAAKLVDACVKPVDKSDLDKLKLWIAQGAPTRDIQPDVATTTPDTLVTDKDRQFWSFQPVQPVRIPTIQNASRVRNPIDAFIQQKLEAKGLSLAPEADRITLLRRASMDLTGLPPTPEELKAHLTDTSPDAHEKMIDKLLQSPRYGERWGRYWLDLVGYADTEGKREQDLPRPHAWRYRDYVISSLNADKPYDRFLLEQLAGDELVDYEKAPAITPEIHDNLVATGFLRMTPDATWANITGFGPDRLEVIADQMDVLGSAVLGLTIKCARCHTHKFDPIPQRDYYRLLAIFKGALDEYDWLKPDIRPGIGPESVDVAPPRQLPHVNTAERTAWEAKKTPLEPKIQALWDRGEPSPTYLYRRGDYLQPTTLVGPGVPSVLTDGKTPFPVVTPWPGANKTGRRLAFAKWVIQPNHPLTARVMVNRVWKLHFGTGIVPTLANFGKTGSAPSHPELLDWLAMQFSQPQSQTMQPNKPWSLKAMHRLIMTSTTYRQSSTVTERQQRLDPSNSLFSRARMTRLDAEALYDTLLHAAGKLDETAGGPAVKVEARPDGLVTPNGTPKGWRRLIYVVQARKQPATHAENFDFPQMNPNCFERRESIVAPQALYLLNNAMVEKLALSFAKRVRLQAGDNTASQVELVYQLGMGRPPNPQESQLGKDTLAKLTIAWANQPPSADLSDNVDGNVKALANYCHAIMNSAAFLYLD
jgi:cytochrome c553